MASRIKASSLADEPYARWLGMRTAALDDDFARVELPYKEENSNPGKQVHGGVVASAMIQAARIAALSAAELNEPFAAGMVTAHVGYLASAVGEPVVAEAKVLRRGKELCYVRSEATNAEGKPLGISTIVYRVAPGADPAPFPAAVDRSHDATGEVGQLGIALTSAPFIAGVGTKADYMKDGLSRLRLPLRDHNLDVDGAVHDGCVAAMLDTCGSLSAWSLVTPRRGVRASTVGIDVNFISAAKGQELMARSRTVGRRREIFFNRVEIEAADGTRIADGTVIYRIVLPE